MISLKLVIPLGCLVALSSALPWSNGREQLQEPADSHYRYRHLPHCDGLKQEDRYSRPDLFQRCVCHAARGEGREYAYTYYGNKYGMPRDVIASTLERCRQPLYRSHRPAGHAASSFDKSRSSFQDLTLDNTISLKKASALTTFASFPADNVQKLGDWSYTKAGTPSYNGIYPNFLTGQSAPDLPIVPSQETPSSQGPTSTSSEENSSPNPVASSLETDDPQDSTEDAFDEHDNPAEAEEDIDDDGEPNDNQESTKAGDRETSDGDLAGKPEETDEMITSNGDPESGDPSSDNHEDSDEQIAEKQEFSRGLLYDLDGGKSSWEGPVAILSRRLNGVQDVNKSPVPVISRGMEAAAYYARGAVETIEESALARRKTEDGEAEMGAVNGRKGFDPEPVSMISRDLGEGEGEGMLYVEPRDSNTEWPTFRTGPGQSDQISPNDDEGEE